MWHEIEVGRCEETIKKIDERIKEATVLRNEFIEYLIKNKQF